MLFHYGQNISQEVVLERDAFADDVKNVFLGSEVAILEKYMHSYPLFNGDLVNGSLIWNKYYNSGSYYVPKFEEEIIAKSSSAITDIISGGKISFIDFGPGCLDSVRKKTLPFLKKNKFASEYHAVDLCEKHARNSNEYVSRTIPHIKCRSHIQDFFSSISTYSSVEKKVGLLFGNTVGNISERLGAKIPVNAIEVLGNIRKTIGENGYLLVSQDTNNNAESLAKAYDNEHGKDYAMNVLHRIGRDVLEDFNPSKFRYEGKWISSDLFYAGYAVATDNQAVTIGNKRIFINKGREYCLYRSYKYSAKYFEEIGIAAGYIPVKTFFDKTGTIALHVWKT